MKHLYKYLLILLLLIIGGFALLFGGRNTMCNNTIKLKMEPIYGIVCMVWDNHFDVDTITDLLGAAPELERLRNPELYSLIFAEMPDSRPNLTVAAGKMQKIIDSAAVQDIDKVYAAYLKFWDSRKQQLSEHVKRLEAKYKEHQTAICGLENDLAVFFGVNKVKYDNFFVPSAGNRASGSSIGDGAIIMINLDREYSDNEILFYISVILHEWNHAMFSHTDTYNKIIKDMPEKDATLFQESIAVAYQGLVLKAIGGDISRPLYNNEKYDRIGREVMPILEDYFKNNRPMDDEFIKMLTEKIQK